MATALPGKKREIAWEDDTYCPPLNPQLTFPYDIERPEKKDKGLPKKKEENEEEEPWETRREKVYAEFLEWKARKVALSTAQPRRNRRQRTEEEDKIDRKNEEARRHRELLADPRYHKRMEQQAFEEYNRKETELAKGPAHFLKMAKYFVKSNNLDEFASEEDRPFGMVHEEEDDEYEAADVSTPTIFENDVIRCKTAYVQDFELFYVHRVDEIQDLVDFEDAMCEFYEEKLKPKKGKMAAWNQSGGNAHTELPRYKEGKEDRSVACIPEDEEIKRGRYFVARLVRLPGEQPRWVRVQVVKTKESNNELVRVHLIDHGVNQQVDAKCLVKILRRFLILQRVAAIPCKFDSNSSNLIRQGIVNRKQIIGAKDRLGTELHAFLSNMEGDELITFINRMTTKEVRSELERREDGWAVSSVVVGKDSVVNFVSEPICDIIIRKWLMTDDKADQKGNRTQETPSTVDEDRATIYTSSTSSTSSDEVWDDEPAWGKVAAPVRRTDLKATLEKEVKDFGDRICHEKWKFMNQSRRAEDEAKCDAKPSVRRMEAKLTKLKM